MEVFFHQDGQLANKEATGSISFRVIDNLGMEKRPRRFSLGEALFEGYRSGGGRTV